MKVWDEDYVVKQLAAARKPKEASSEQEARKLERDLKSKENPIKFLLILVRKFAQKHYEFIYLPANCYDQVEKVYNETDVVLTHAEHEDSDGNEIWIGRSAEHDDDNFNEGFKITTTFDSYYVGKAIFHTATGEPLVKVEGSAGWKEALRQKYLNIDALSYKRKEEKEEEDDQTAAKAAAAAALGAGAAAGGASVVAATTATTAAIEAGTAYGAGTFAASGGFGAASYGAGYGAAGYGLGAGYGGLGYGAATGYGGLGYGAATGYGASGLTYGASSGATSWASWAAANGIATGASTAGSSTAASAGTAAAMATPVGVVAAVGAVGGLGVYYVMHRRNKAKKALEEAMKEGPASAEKLYERDEGSSATVVTDDDSSCEGEVHAGYMPLDGFETEEQDFHLNLWVTLFVKRVDGDDSNCVFVPVVCATRKDAEQAWSRAAENVIARALFGQEGEVLQLEVDPADHDAWETALALHYDFLEDQKMLSSLRGDEDSDEDAPLVDNNAPGPPQKQKQADPMDTASNWVMGALRKKRQQLGQIRDQVPGKLGQIRDQVPGSGKIPFLRPRAQA